MLHSVEIRLSVQHTLYIELGIVAIPFVSSKIKIRIYKILVTERKRNKKNKYLHYLPLVRYPVVPIQSYCIQIVCDA